MKKRILSGLLCMICIGPLCAQVENNFAANELIIKFKINNRPNSKTAIYSKTFGFSNLDVLNAENTLQSVRLIGDKKRERTYVLRFNTSRNIKRLIETYKNTGLFEYVEPNFVGSGHGALQTTPNDNFYSRQWMHYNDGTFALIPSTNDADMDTDLAWDITQGDANLVVAILDTGLKLDHPEVTGRIWVNTNETLNASDSDSNGYIDDVNAGWDFVNNDNDPTDDHGHGTNVTGVAMASGNNAIGYAGMNWNSQIMVCKILDDDNRGFYSDWADAIYYAVDNGAHVINLSAGGHGASSLLKDAIDYAHSNNVPVVVSAGNENAAIQYPARYANAFAIGATNPDDTRSAPFAGQATGGSNYGSELDFVAPGNYVYGLAYNSDTNYDSYWSGTSQAAPQVTGLVSLLLSTDSSLTVNQIRTILEQTSEDRVGHITEDTAGWDSYHGYGRINAYQALSSNLLSLNASRIQTSWVYPNPFGDRLFINSGIRVNHAVVTNVLGKKVLEITNNDGIEGIDTKALSRGVYFLSFIEGNGQSRSIKIVKE